MSNYPTLDEADHQKYLSSLTAVEARAFERAVNRAAAIVSQNLAQIHRRRLVTQTAISTLIVAGLIAIAVILYVHNSDVAANKAGINYTCSVVKALTKAETDFVNSDAQLRLQQAQVGNTPQIRKAFEKIIPKSSLLRIEVQTNALSVAYANRWKNDILPTLQSIEKANCEVK